MRVVITLTPAAERDLEEISERISAEAGERVALSVIRRIRGRISMLTDHPELGVRSERLGGRRALHERPYTIVYRLASTSEVRISRVVHGARDMQSLSFDD